MTPQADPTPGQEHMPQGRPAALALGALGVVFGDIGTSPLYALKESLHHATHGNLTRADVIGIVSLAIIPFEALAIPLLYAFAEVVAAMKPTT